MPLVTFTSDLGLSDYYVAVVKGTLLSDNPSLNIIDISHNVKSFDIVQGAYILKNAFHSFPEGRFTLYLLMTIIKRIDVSWQLVIKAIILLGLIMEYFR